jgi:hypothetical protein
MSKLNNTKGNIIVFALAAIAVMSLSAVVLTSTTFLELRKSGNVERSIFATYMAESTGEQSVYLISQALKVGKTFAEIEDVLNLPGYDGSVPVPCGSAPGDSPIDCQQLNIVLGVNDLPINLQQNETMTINIFDQEDRNLGPYDVNYQIDQMVIEWSAGYREFELSFVVWNVSAGVNLLPPIRRRISGNNGKVVFNFNDICNSPISSSESEACSGMGGNFLMGQNNLGKIRVRVLGVEPLVGGVLRLCKYDQAFTDNCNQKPVPGFIEINSTGRQGSNKQAVKIVHKIGESDKGSEFVSEVWDYAIFSQKSLSK